MTYQDTATMMTSSDYKERFKAEYYQTKIRHDKLHRMLTEWGEIAAKLKAGEITKEEYDRWRYRYPEFDTTGKWHKVAPPQGLSDMLIQDI